MQYASVVYVTERVPAKKKVKRHLTSQAHTSGAFTTVEVVSDRHWL